MMTTLVLIGTVLSNGVPCARIELDDGRRVWISGLPRDIAPGDKVMLDGEWRSMRGCNATAFVVTEAEVLSPAPGSEE